MMMKCLVFICLLFTCLFDCGVDCTLRVVPNNTAVVVGDTAVFNCSTDSNSSVQWILDGLATDIPPVTIYDGTTILPGFSDRYSILSADSGQFDLQLVNTSKRDAGVYICVELDTTDAVNASAIFTVLAGQPNCSSSAEYKGSAEGDEVALVCVVEFNGTAWQRPRMAWFLDGQLVTNHTQVWIKDVLVWSWCNFTAELPTTDAYTCETYFSTPVPSTDHTPNLSQTAPTLTLNWTSPVVAVLSLYPPTNTTISGAVSDQSVDINSVLSCTSNGLPAPSYSWTDADTNGGSQVTQNGSQLTVTRSGWRQVTCTASNYIHSQLNTQQATIKINVIGSTGLSGGEIAGIVIGTLCGVALIAAGVCYFVYYKRKDDEMPHTPLP